MIVTLDMIDEVRHLASLGGARAFDDGRIADAIREAEEPRASDGRFGTVAGEHASIARARSKAAGQYESARSKLKARQAKRQKKHIRQFHDKHFRQKMAAVTRPLAKIAYNNIDMVSPWQDKIEAVVKLTGKRSVPVPDKKTALMDMARQAATEAHAATGEDKAAFRKLSVACQDAAARIGKAVADYQPVGTIPAAYEVKHAAKEKRRSAALERKIADHAAELEKKISSYNSWRKWIKGDGETKESLIAESAPIPTVNAAPAIADPIEALLAAAIDQGNVVLHRVTKSAVERLVELPAHTIGHVTNLFSDAELLELTEELAAARLAADMLGRSLLGERGQKARKSNRLKESLSSSDAGCLDVPIMLQDDNWSCGAVAFKAVMAYQGIQLTEEHAGRLLHSSPTLGTLPDALAELARDLNCQVEEKEGATLADLAAALERDAPVIVCVQRQGCGHWIVVDGFDDFEQTVTVMDPLDGRKTVPAASFLGGWWDTAGGHFFDHYMLAVGAPKPLAESLRPAALIDNGRLLEMRLIPQAAIDFFRGLHLFGPGPDPLHNLNGQRRNSFTLAFDVGKILLGKIKDVITGFLGNDPGRQLNTVGAVQDILDEAGVSPKNPEYATMVVRTNVMSGLAQGTQDQLSAEAETFPAWEYSNPCDSRSRPRHARNNAMIFSTSIPFNAVRGTDAKEVINCRCVPVAISKWDLADMLKAGRKMSTLADAWLEVS